MNCPNCNHQFKLVAPKTLHGFSGLWCPHCSKVFAIPLEVEEKKIPKRKPTGQIKSRYERLVDSAKTRKLEITISKAEFITWWSNLPEVCHYCGSTLEDIDYLHKKFYKTSKWSHYFSSSQLTVDRMDSSLGYHRNNVVKACLACNIIKQSIMTEQEALLICPAIIKRLKEL